MTLIFFEPGRRVTLDVRSALWTPSVDIDVCPPHVAAWTEVIPLS